MTNFEMLTTSKRVLQAITHHAVFGTKVAIALAKDKEVQGAVKGAALRVAGFGLWAIALTALAFLNVFLKACQLRKDARAQWDEYNVTAIVGVATMASACVAYWCGVQVFRFAAALWQSAVIELGVIVKDFAAFSEDAAWFSAQADLWLLLMCDRAIRFTAASINGACSLSIAGVKLISG